MKLTIFRNRKIHHTSSNGLNSSIVTFVFWGGRNSIQNQPTSKNSNSTSRQHFRFSNHWVFDDLQPPSFFIGTSSTRLPPHHPYTAAFMWVPKMIIDAVLDKTRSVDVCHTANGGLIPCSPVEHSFALFSGLSHDVCCDNF